MKLYLASFFEPVNHGPGRKIGIAPAKPKNLLTECGYECEINFEPLSPGQLYYDYHKMKKIDIEIAGRTFSEGYKKQLVEFVETVRKQGSPQEVLPFQEGDTLLTWEKRGNTSYRYDVADCLRELGYEVEEN